MKKELKNSFNKYKIVRGLVVCIIDHYPLRNRFDLEATFLGVVQLHWAAPLFTQIRKIQISYLKDFC